MFEDEVDKLNVKTEVLEILLKMAFGLPAQDSAETIKQILKKWRNHKSLIFEERVKVKKEVCSIVRRIWNNYNMIEESERVEYMLKIYKRILLVKLYMDYQRIQFEIRSGNLKTDSTNRKIEGKALVWKLS